MEISKIKFPVIWIKNKDNSMGVYKNGSELTTCLKGTEKFYDNLYIISSSGNRYQIENVTKTDKKIPLNKWKFLKYFGYYNIEVKINFLDKIEELTLKELKEIVINKLNDFYGFWDADGRLPQLLELLTQADSKKRVVSLLEKKYFEQPFD